ncbi:KpsF/GutQ family sugar-phosphate isomerase [Paraburkholderia caribensis]|jgi:arabinose-5-phosphate isomerase|uniref:Arabinose-5-phosphate isomerase n=2 Tax=Pseudomonadota TaxID=1224 RepID=A0A9Q6WP98_9BURK|nr:KpsF/GutQ family sugar-phosphate isomerase [Paraburkholderia caribensis]ALP64892.1 arabinose 5-phosphate isomerase [Paraburkholderia caribensis]AMV44768.1 arabinose-5-phosphate isomerase [Paraburkholderia caribensis]AUT53959.1 KpsF/GutQ family sugar-phosphate isomerase [Paraburkholderia caribensis]MCO4876902.1 KpsF/GutQ family sugar-phosphate isomerase [Paraburkholderia caribensis]PTB30741.1 KpsF/GutQ family sugar-phosphate isomerase [Paraburkholderia caribensis]
MNNPWFVASAARVFEVEARAVAALVARLDDNYSEAVRTIIDSTGRVIVCGMGKSGIVGRKIAATLSSTGTPAFFMHPAEAYHGDLGMVQHSDVFIAISNSGETNEVIQLLPFLRQNGNKMIAFTGNPSSTLAKAAHCHLDIGVETEACPLQLAPTASTTATLAMGDALAVTLMEARDFKPENFARFHPGGSLGRRLLRMVEDEMVSDNLPFIDGAAKVMEVLSVMTKSKLGLAIVRNEAGDGLITDGDVRRLLEEHEETAFEKSATEFMSRDPVVVQVGTRVEDALVLLERHRITSLLVVDHSGIVGVFKK